MPALTPVVDKLEDVPEPARQFYTAKDGKYHVDLSGAPSGFVPASELASANGKIVEFRNNNIALTKTVEELTPLKDKFTGIDPDTARAAIAAQAKLKEKGIEKPDDIQTMIAAVIAPLNQKIEAMTTATAEERRRNDDMLLAGQLGDLFIKAGGLPEAKEFIAGRAKGVFVVENGQVVAAKNMFSADKPGEPLSMAEWLTKQTKEASFAFKPSGGSGAAPGTPGATSGVTLKPGQILIKDPTPQQLGEYGARAAKGEIKFEYST